MRVDEGRIHAMLGRSERNAYEDELSVWLEQDGGLSAEHVGLWTWESDLRRAAPVLAGALLRRWRDESVDAAAGVGGGATGLLEHLDQGEEQVWGGHDRGQARPAVETQPGEGGVARQQGVTCGDQEGAACGDQVWPSPEREESLDSCGQDLDGQDQKSQGSHDMGETPSHDSQLSDCAEMAKREAERASGSARTAGARLVRKAVVGASAPGSILFSTIGELGSEDQGILQDQRRRERVAREAERAAARLLRPPDAGEVFAGGMGGTTMPKRWTEERSLWMRAGVEANYNGSWAEGAEGEAPAAPRKRKERKGELQAKERARSGGCVGDIAQGRVSVRVGIEADRDPPGAKTRMSRTTSVSYVWWTNTSRR